MTPQHTPIAQYNLEIHRPQSKLTLLNAFPGEPRCRFAEARA
jgi:hypothetical protein